MKEGDRMAIACHKCGKPLTWAEYVRGRGLWLDRPGLRLGHSETGVRQTLAIMRFECDGATRWRATLNNKRSISGDVRHGEPL